MAEKGKTSIISLSLYKEDIEALDGVVKALQETAINPGKVNRSTAFRKLIEVYNDQKEQ